MKSFREHLNEAKGLSQADMQKIAKAVAEDQADGADESTEELIGMYLENYSGGEEAGAKEIKTIAKMVSAHKK